ncbi:hypothetical protein L550_1119 [Bordetella pertussis H973]|uniref:Uncharacterized protein n=2 Tax=Bordetella TaxID=517 RepID=A0AAI9J2B4_BORPT|nr:hypothetical protein V483_1458 [Bordetella pertussis CHLA-11]ETG99038.1 hypothetical protein L569_1468 [Bordetella pertussis 2250905]ETH05127.1 hypothetical protein L570_1385 [Bordetella pertussis 2356847]ETH09255.1 hypothetical protein L571_1402 [Bordetella pertussis 2371640]ETH10561.1 hypothetical protein L574_1182 [Bordetella pertussis STO1-SEAT-0006]ETH16358.1 hypothetical protein L575_1823 [Bordetella pertussis STO1-SEAT-0007]ETH20773.1 hypothetical protein L563_1313 [Bordetella pertu
MYHRRNSWIWKRKTRLPGRVLSGALLSIYRNDAIPTRRMKSLTRLSAEDSGRSSCRAQQHLDRASDMRQGWHAGRHAKRRQL